MGANGGKAGLFSPLLPGSVDRTLVALKQIMHDAVVGTFRPARPSPLTALQDGKLPLGAHYLGDGTCSFNVWAPFCSEVSVVLQGSRPREIPLARSPDGYFSA